MATNNALNNNIATCTGLPVTGLSLAANSAMIVTTDSGVSEMTASLTDGQIVVGSTGATPVPATLTAGSGISITNGAGSITIASSSTDPAWVTVTSATNAVVNGSYVANGGSQVVLTLPTTAAVGTFLSVAGLGAGGWRVAQNADQYIRIGSAVSTTGASGYVESANQYDSMQLRCIEENLGWTCFTGPLSSGLEIV